MGTRKERKNSVYYVQLFVWLRISKAQTIKFIPCGVSLEVKTSNKTYYKLKSKFGGRTAGLSNTSSESKRREIDGVFVL